eukprot:gene6186-6821_t
MMKKKGSDSSSSLWNLSPSSYFYIGLFLVLGYCFILFSLLFGSDGSVSSPSDELIALRMQLERASKSLMESQQTIRELQSSQNIINNNNNNNNNNSPPRLRSVAGSTVTSNALSNPNNNAVVLARSSGSDGSHSPPSVRPGVIVLGMHRSGTSLLGGLLNKMGLETGGPLIQPAPDNPKGFFERIDIVLQDDTIMANQNVHYSHNTYKYDALRGLQDVLRQRDTKWFAEGERGLAFLNNPDNYPWMLKDPRLCITIRTWLPLLNFVPAVVFTYRHPLDVAMSMNKRGFEHFKVNKGLRIWYVYNRRAIEQSNDLCRVITSHRKTMQQPEIELKRIYEELKTNCGVPVPHALERNEIASFVDINLQHGRSSLTPESVCKEDLANLKPPDSWQTTDADHMALYRECIRAYCAMEDGSAFSPSFQWNTKIRDD